MKKNSFLRNAEEQARAILSIKDTPDYPQIYSIADMAGTAAFNLYAIATEPRRTPEMLTEARVCYHFLNILWTQIDLKTLLDKSKKQWLEREDDFLPDDFPAPNLSECKSLLEALIIFSWNIRTAATQYLDSRISKKSLDSFAQTIQRSYGRSVSVQFTRKIQALLEKEYGLYRKRKPHESKGVKKAEAARILGVTRQRIHQLVKNGKLTEGADGKITLESFMRILPEYEAKQIDRKVDKKLEDGLEMIYSLAESIGITKKQKHRT